MYRIEKLEARLTTTPTGRQIAAVFEEHVEEVMLLINNNRKVMVAWHRNHGPEFIGSAVRSGYEDGFRVFQEVQGVTLSQLIRRMAAVLQEEGTPGLKEVIATYFAMIFSWSGRMNSLIEVFEALEEMEKSKEGKSR